jgi:hypothetical protein
MTMVVYIYYIRVAVNSISSQLGSSRQGNLYSTEKAGGMARPSCTKSHLPGHSPSAIQAGRHVSPALYSLRPHWFQCSLQISEWWINKRHNWVSSALLFIEGSHSHGRKSAPWHKFDMVWQYLTIAYPSGKERVFYSIKLLLPAFTTLRERGRVQHPALETRSWCPGYWGTTKYITGPDSWIIIYILVLHGCVHLAYTSNCKLTCIYSMYEYLRNSGPWR